MSSRLVRTGFDTRLENFSYFLAWHFCAGILHASFARRVQNSAGARDPLSFASGCFREAVASHWLQVSFEMRGGLGDPVLCAK
jgi:hypothetical protein